jgi:hypothetical protein
MNVHQACSPYPAKIMDLHAALAPDIYTVAVHLAVLQLAFVPDTMGSMGCHLA